MQTEDRNDSVALFFLIDGLGWEYIKNRAFLSPLAKTAGPSRTVLGFSASAIPTILSGKMPAETGHGNLFYYDPAHSIFGWTRRFRWLPEDAINCIPYVRVVYQQFLVRVTKRLSRYSGYFNIYSVPLKYRYLFNYNESKNVFTEGLRFGETIFDVVRRKGFPHALFAYSQPDRNTMAALRTTLQKREARFCFAYLTEMDGFLHQHCHEQTAVQERISWYEDNIRSLYKVACENFETVHLYVFSDHGMTPTHRTFDLIAHLDRLPFKMPQDYVVFYDSTMARFWFFSDEARFSIVEQLQCLDCGRILSDDELRQEGAYFPDHRFGQIFFLMQPGVIIEPSFMGARAPRGMHGFHPDDRWSDAMFVSNNPNASPRHIRDFYSIMSAEIENILRQNGGSVMP